MATTQGYEGRVWISNERVSNVYISSDFSPNQEVARALVEQGANLLAVYKQEQNAIHLAAQWQRPRVMKVGFAFEWIMHPMYINGLLP